MMCKFIKEDGTRCGMRALKGSDLCFTHNPDVKEQKALAVKNGGENRKTFVEIGDYKEIKSPKDIRDILGEGINLLRTGKMPCNNPPGALAYLCKAWLDAHEISEVEDRIISLEDRLDKAGM